MTRARRGGRPPGFGIGAVSPTSAALPGERSRGLPRCTRLSESESPTFNRSTSHRKVWASSPSPSTSASPCAWCMPAAPGPRSRRPRPARDEPCSRADFSPPPEACP
jgi:hypothetical protein